MRIKICRKEAKESRYWLRLVGAGDDATVEKDRLELLKEATELTNIFGAILRKRIKVEINFELRDPKLETILKGEIKNVPNRIDQILGFRLSQFWSIWC